MLYSVGRPTVLAGLFLVLNSVLLELRLLLLVVRASKVDRVDGLGVGLFLRHGGLNQVISSPPSSIRFVRVTSSSDELLWRILLRQTLRHSNLASIVAQRSLYVVQIGPVSHRQIRLRQVLLAAAMSQISIRVARHPCFKAF